jgi:hypothetical protein
MVAGPWKYISLTHCLGKFGGRTSIVGIEVDRYILCVARIDVGYFRVDTAGHCWVLSYSKCGV